MRPVFDAETDGLYDTVSRAHVLRMIDRDSGERLRFTDHKYYADGTVVEAHGTLQDALKLLRGAPEVFSQNGIKYDEPVLAKLYPGFKTRRHFDTRVASSVIWTNIKDVDFSLLRAGKLPQEFQKLGLIGTHKLKAWGYRLDPDGARGWRKGDFDPADYGYTWANVPFLREMDDYCAQDCEVTLAWVEKIESKNYAPECLYLEHRVAEIIAQQERNGFGFDVAAAERLYADLQKQKLALEEQLQQVFPPWAVVTKRAISKVNNKKLGRVKGEEYVVEKTMLFNPGSRDHIADRLQRLRGWKPSEFTPEGKPKVDEEILSALPYPEAKPISDYLTVVKKLGQLGDGKADVAWLKVVKNDGRIYGTVNTNGAVTGRMTHARPNVAQADKDPLMRSLWIPAPGKVLVGCDAEGLELRMLGHYMAAYDGGAYATTVVEGKKEDGTDVHTVNQRAAGLNKRDSAKKFIYALLYGAGDFKLGTIVYDDFTDEQKAKFNAQPGNRDRLLATLGKARRAKLMSNLPALGRLTEAVKAKAKKTKTLRGLDGRILHVRSEHAALNTLLQSGGAVVMKKALVLKDDAITANKKLCGRVADVANVHDEFQMETDPDIADQVGRLAADCIRLAGEHFSLKCPLAGDYAIGANWAKTH